METLTFENKIAQLPAELKLKAEGYVDALLSEYNLKLSEVLPYNSTELIESDLKPKAGFGSMKGLIKYMADSFDAPLEQFNDYM